MDRRSAIRAGGVAALAALSGRFSETTVVQQKAVLP